MLFIWTKMTPINRLTRFLLIQVLNSLDAKSTAVAVRVNLLTFQIQVVDNGSGITKSNMIPIGNRFMTNKCRSLTDLKNIKYSGFRGEALASIRGISKSLSITSRPEDVENTYSKVCKNGKWGEVECIKQRPSKGTTVTVEGFMNNLPVRQKRINQSVDMENIRKMLESLAIINSKVSFNLRNDANGKTIFKSSKTLSVSQALVNFYPHISIDNLVQVKVSRDKITISGLIYKATFNCNKLQFLYLNKRVIISAKIQKLVNSLLSKVIVQKSKTHIANDYDKNVGSKYEYPVYVLNIRCPYSEVDLTLCPTKKNVEFKNWDIILACFKKAINSLAQDEKRIDLNNSKEITSKMEVKLPLERCKSQFGISQIGGVIKSVPIRRNKIIEKPSKSSLKIGKEDQFSDSSSNIQMLNPGTKSHCDDTIEKLILSCDGDEKEIGLNSKVGDKRKMKGMGSENQTKKFKVDESLNDSNSFFCARISKSDGKKPKISRTNNEIPLKKVAERVRVRSSNNAANSCENLSFNSTGFKCFPIFEPNLNIKEKSSSKNLSDNFVSAKEQGSEVKNIERELNKLPSEHKSDSKSTNNQDVVENEAEGRKFIMDMFLKSTAIFLTDEELSANQNDAASNEKEVEVVVSKIVDSGEGKDEQSNEKIEKLNETPAEEVFPKICFGQLKVNDMKMPQFGSMECFRQTDVYENINILSEEFHEPVCLKNYGIDENIFENGKYRTKSICYTKSVYKTTVPKAILNLDTYQQLMQPKPNCYNFLNEDKRMFPNFENNFTNCNRNSLVPLYQRYHHKSHMPKIKQNIFEQKHFNYNFTTRKINSFGIKFCKNIDRKVNSNFEKQDYAFKSVDDKLREVELHKSVLRPSIFNFSSKPKNFVVNEVYNDNFHYGKKKLHESKFQLSIPDLPIKNRDHIFKKPCDVPVQTKEIRKFRRPLPVPGMEVIGCSSPYFGKRTEKIKTNFFSKDQRNVFCFKENRSNNRQNVEDKNARLQFFQKNQYGVCQNDQMNKSKYFKTKKSPLLENNGKPNFFNEDQETGQKADFVLHFKNTETFSSIIDKQRHSEKYLKNTEVVDDLFPKTKSIERKKFIECPPKKPQFSKLSLKKLKSNSAELFPDPPTMDFQEKSIYFQQKSIPKSSFKDSNDKFELPSKNKNFKNIDITFKSDGKMIYQEKEEISAFVDDEPAKKFINCTEGFIHFQPKLSSTVIDKVSPNEERVDENININVENKEGNNPNNFILPIIEKVTEIENFNCFSKEVENQRPASDKNMDDCEKQEPSKNCSVLNVSIDNIRKIFTSANEASRNEVDDNEEPRKICSILNASILELKRALLTSVEVNNETQKNCSILNTSIADLKTIFSEINKKKGSNSEILKSLPEKLNEEWMEHVDEFGKVTYLNRRTGMTSLIKPCDNSNFSLAPRIDFVPKGFSPLLKQSKEIDVSLSPKSKVALNTALLKSYEDELNTIKWENLIGEFTDVKQFFDNLYREKTKQFDRLIPNASISTLPRGIVKICNNLEAESITKDIFDDLTIIGQWDKKFIISLVKEKGMLVLFDQHAVHERIRLENLLEEYMEADQEVHKFKSTKCGEPVVFELSDTEINILLNYQHLLEDLGLIYKIFTNTIYIFYIPTCIYNRILKNSKKLQEIELKKFVSSLVCEEINTILSTRGIGIKIPLLMQNVLNSEACRGAIKFGDKLNLNECADLIQKLSKCKLPFQCAHGRPTITPILNLQQNVHNKQGKINLKNFK